MTDQGVLRTAEPIWHEETSYSPPRLSTPGLDFNAQPAEGPEGPTVALLGRYRVGSPHLDYYGGQMPRPVWVVAVNAQSGEIYMQQCVEDERPPVRVVASDREAEAQGRGTEFQSGCFNVDLGAQAMLPREAATYRVFLWLDDLVSPIKVAQIPENRKRRESGLPSSRRPSELVEFGAFPGAPAAAGSAMALAASTQPGDRTICGVWSPDRAKIASRREESEPYYLMLLAFNHRDRSFGWVSVDATQLPQGTDPGSFRIDPLKIVGGSEMQQKVFVLAVSEDGMSNVLVGRHAE